VAGRNAAPSPSRDEPDQPSHATLARTRCPGPATMPSGPHARLLRQPRRHASGRRHFAPQPRRWDMGRGANSSRRRGLARQSANFIAEKMRRSLRAAEAACRLRSLGSTWPPRLSASLRIFSAMNFDAFAHRTDSAACVTGLCQQRCAGLRTPTPPMVNAPLFLPGPSRQPGGEPHLARSVAPNWRQTPPFSARRVNLAANPVFQGPSRRTGDELPVLSPSLRTGGELP
jgi:hypothetical protein